MLTAFSSALDPTTIALGSQDILINAQLLRNRFMVYILSISSNAT